MVPLVDMINHDALLGQNTQVRIGAGARPSQTSNALGCPREQLGELRARYYVL